MEFSEARTGRVFILRMKHSEVIHEVLEKFCAEKNIRFASLHALGGADNKSVVITGPEDGNMMPPIPTETVLEGVHEVSGTGTVFPDSSGKPSLHMHCSFGRKDKTITGCVRKGVTVWHVLEVIITELTGTQASRKYDSETGFELLHP